MILPGKLIWLAGFRHHLSNCIIFGIYYFVELLNKHIIIFYGQAFLGEKWGGGLNFK